MELVEEEEEEEEEEEDDEEPLEELSVVDALDELVWVLDVALELVPLEVWVTEELELSVPVEEALSVLDPTSG